jgi:prepilin-type N-terminal cleavage/methylation domain-containing protein
MNIRQVLMGQLKAKIFDNSGVTLIELLLTLTISAIVLPVCYGTLLTGYKVYEKISIEGQMRDDADYVSSMIMNSLYDHPFDYIESCNNNSSTCVQLVDNKETAVTSYNKNGFYDIVNDADKTVGITSFNVELAKQGDKDRWLIDHKTLDTESDFTNSQISFICSTTDGSGKCVQGMIHLELTVNDSKFKKTIKLKSQFGF